MVEEKVIQQESVTSVEQSVAATDAPQTPPAVDVEAVKADYEAKLTQERASREKAEKETKSSKASKVNLMMSIKNKMTKGNKTSKTKGNGKPYGKKPTKPPKKKIK